ncbi:hypothetical protein ACE3MZ_21025 [Paenibacillus sp. WLX1005]|uniref:hypothetical protein n=1 Tax=Paenibacillus sp. WLX1005 TaxID=3243766 RepID=UPI0039840963
MGVNFTAYFPHDLSVEQIQELCHSLNTRIEEFPSIHQFVEYLLPYNPQDVVQEWKFYFNGIGGTTEIVGPCGI